MASATQEVEEKIQQWDSQAPFILEKLQEVDENRLIHLRNVLTQFQTHEMDLVGRNREITGACLSTLVEVKVEEEVRIFSSKTATGRPKVEKQRSRTATGSTLAPSSSLTGTDDAASQRSGLSGGANKSGLFAMSWLASEHALIKYAS